ncbi:MAG: glycoside hydrolase family 26 protein, partial [Clostridiales bacterium]|nr:glycoside hydrolase family 26 protein [Clostridiales bacterium]
AEGNYVYTIFIKASAPVYLLGGYAYLVEAFNTTPVTVSAYTRRTVAVDADERGWNSETRWFYDTFFADNAPLAWGIFEPKTASFDFTRIERYEDVFSYTFPILLYYSDFQNGGSHPYLKRMLETAYDHGKVLELTLQTGATEDGGNQVYDVLNGDYDAFLQDYAETVAGFQHPVLFRLGNEMNGDWCPYSSWHTAKDTAVYRAFYRYVYGFFERAEADNVIWVWNPNGGSYPDFKWNHELMYYPGDAFVDIVGMTKYNTGTYYSSFGERWREFDELYDALYLSYTTRYTQPLMITEFASASMGGDKEQWVERMFAHIGQYPRIKAAVWWDYCDWDAAGNLSRSYFIEETQALMDIFRLNLQQSAPAAWIGLRLSQDIPVLPQNTDKFPA